MRAAPRVFVAAAGLAAVLAASPAPAADNYLTTPGAARSAVGKIVEEMERVPRLLRIEIAGDHVTLVAGGGAKGWHLEEWSIATGKMLLLFERERVSGPRPVEHAGPVQDVESGFFDLEEVTLGAADRLAIAAIERAALEDPAEVTEMRIERRMSIMPKPSYGDLVWSVAVASPHESATIYADGTGAIVGADLSQTRRARLLNLLSGEWPADEAQRQLRAVLGAGAIIQELRINDRTVAVEAVSPDNADEMRTYSWDLSGVSRGLVDIPLLSAMVSLAGRKLFSMDDIDLTVCRSLRDEAKARLEMPQGVVTSMAAYKSTEGLSDPAVEWHIEVTDADGAKGEAVADAAGRILRVRPPAGRGPEPDWLSPQGMRDGLDAIGVEFGSDAVFYEIMIDPDRARVVAADPQQSGKPSEFLFDGHEVRRWNSDVFFFDPAEQETFLLEEAAAIDAAGFKAMIDETLARLGIADARVFRVTISRGNVFVKSERNLITVEVRAESADRSQSGRVTFEPDGRAIDIVGP